MSQMTAAEMDFNHTSTTASHQHKLQWLIGEALNWSGLPVTQLRPTVSKETHSSGKCQHSKSGIIPLPHAYEYIHPIDPPGLLPHVLLLIGNIPTVIGFHCVEVGIKGLD
ncbi:hypothetical protein V8C26DRAFT_275578 [Trichoderma gracile]